ncbi:hypothetical protein JCM10212_005521 [Sporobolomyces blumeae]
MLPPRRTPVAAPLLTFPPSPPSSAPPSLPPVDHSTPSPALSLARLQQNRSPHSKLYRTCALLPMLFIAALLAFSFYAFFYSLCIDYLVVHRERYAKALVLGSLYLWFFLGCSGSLAMAYVRGGAGSDSPNVVTGAGQLSDGTGFDARDGRETGPGRDEEAAIGGKGDTIDGTTYDEGEEVVVDDGIESAPLLIRGRNGRIKTLQVKHDGTARFCRKCNVLKPDRAHHCSTCKRCILKLDHHCPWLGGACIGFANYKFFILFLLYTGLLGLFVGVFSFRELINFVDDSADGFEMAPISWALAALLGCIFGGAVGLFGLYHVYLAAGNRTTIEAMESPTTFISTLPPPHLLQPPSARAASRPHSPRPTPSRSALIQQFHSRLSPKQKNRLTQAKRKYNVYDLGWKDNLRQVFEMARSSGDESGRAGRDDEPSCGGSAEGRVRWWEWGIPWGRPVGDGTSFPINRQNLQKLEEITAQVYAEVEAEERERQRDVASSVIRGHPSTGRYETENPREGGYAADEGYSSDDDRPLRRA